MEKILPILMLNPRSSINKAYGYPSNIRGMKRFLSAAAFEPFKKNLFETLWIEGVSQTVIYQKGIL